MNQQEISKALRSTIDGTSDRAGQVESGGLASDFLGQMRMVVCSLCGNKRCPRANDVTLLCTGSNDPDQQQPGHEESA